MADQAAHIDIEPVHRQCTDSVSAPSVVDLVSSKQHDVLANAAFIVAAMLKSPEMHQAWVRYYPSKKGDERNPLHQAVHHLEGLAAGRDLDIAEQATLFSFMHEMVRLQHGALGAARQDEPSHITQIRSALHEAEQYLAVRASSAVNVYKASEKQKRAERSRWYKPFPELRTDLQFALRGGMRNGYYHKIQDVWARHTFQKPFSILRTAKNIGLHSYDEFAEIVSDKYKRWLLAGTIAGTVQLGIHLNKTIGAGNRPTDPETAGFTPFDDPETFVPEDISNASVECHYHVQQMAGLVLDQDSSRAVADWTTQNLPIPQHCPSFANASLETLYRGYKDSVFDTFVTDIAYHVTAHPEMAAGTALAGTGVWAWKKREQIISGVSSLHNNTVDALKPTPLKAYFGMTALGTAAVLSESAERVAFEATQLFARTNEHISAFAQTVYDVNLVENLVLHPVFAMAGFAGTIYAASIGKERRGEIKNFIKDSFSQAVRGRPLKYAFGLAGGIAAYQVTGDMNASVVISSVLGAMAGNTLQKAYTNTAHNQQRVEEMSKASAPLMHEMRTQIEILPEHERLLPDVQKSKMRQVFEWSASVPAAAYTTTMIAGVAGIDTFNNPLVQNIMVNSTEVASAINAGTLVGGAFLPFNLVEDSGQHVLWSAGGAAMAAVPALAIVLGKMGYRQIVPASQSDHDHTHEHSHAHLHYHIVEDDHVCLHHDCPH